MIRFLSLPAWRYINYRVYTVQENEEEYGNGTGRKTIESKEIYAGEIIKVRYDLVQLPDGKRSGREIVEHSGE